MCGDAMCGWGGVTLRCQVRGPVGSWMDVMVREWRNGRLEITDVTQPCMQYPSSPVLHAVLHACTNPVSRRAWTLYLPACAACGLHGKPTMR